MQQHKLNWINQPEAILAILVLSSFFLLTFLLSFFFMSSTTKTFKLIPKTHRPISTHWFMLWTIPGVNIIFFAFFHQKLIQFLIQEKLDSPIKKIGYIHFGLLASIPTLWLLILLLLSFQLTTISNILACVLGVSVIAACVSFVNYWRHLIKLRLKIEYHSFK